MAQPDNSDTTRLQLRGVQTLRTADATHAALMDAASHHKVLEIDCDGADEVDLSFIQLLLAARASARLADRTIRLIHAPRGALRDALERGGFLDGPEADREFWSSAEQI